LHTANDKKGRKLLFCCVARLRASDFAARQIFAK